MKKMRIPLLVAWGLAIIGIIFGSLFDFRISSAIASPSNAYGLLLSAIIPTIGFAGVAIVGGGFIALAIKGKYHIALKILFFVLAALCLAVAVHYPAGEYFGVNGFYNPKLKYAGYLITILPEIGAMIGGYFLFRDCQNKRMWIIFLIIIVLLLIALLGVIPGLKGTMHRPRYRLVETGKVAFHDWWKPCKNYATLIKELGPSSDNFKSYPSGHTAEACILLVPITFLPLAHEKYERWQPMLHILGCLLVILVAFARILAAAHYLSDVSTGATIMLTLLLIANEIVVRIKPLHNQSAA